MWYNTYKYIFKNLPTYVSVIFAYPPQRKITMLHTLTIPFSLYYRTDTLHPARFLPGAGVPVKKLWLEARKLWGQEGVDPIGNFDVETISCSGCVTPRGWEMLHKPGSPEISIKMYTISNVAHAATGSRTLSLAGEDGLTISESWKELSDMADLKMAMKNLLMAAHLAAP